MTRSGGDKEAVGARFFGDRPIFHPRDDAFGHSSFADALATSLIKVSPDGGLVISIEGPWGAGKSSAIALAIRTIKLSLLTKLGASRSELEQLDENQLDAKWIEKARTRDAHIIRFNPWNFSGQENLVRAFFSELGAQIEVEPDGRIKKAINQLAGYLPSVAGGLAAGGTLATGNLPAAAAAGVAGRAAGEAAERALRFASSLEGAKKKLAEALSDRAQRIIVIIDDLDRLLPSEMRAVLSMVKSLGDLPNVLYVLSFDREVVEKALTNCAEKIDPAFLEKIVQVALKLPPPWRNELRQLLFTRLNAVIKQAVPANEERWRHIFRSAIEPYLETPRDVTRLVNTIQVIWPNVEGDVDLADLLAISALQLFDPEVYALIWRDIEVITHADYHYENDKDFGERMLPKFARKPDVAKEAMASLFPRLAKAWNKFTGDGASYIVQKEQRRISTKEYHRNYFVFGRDRRMLSRAEIEEFIYAPDPTAALTDVLKRLEEETLQGETSRVATFLEQIGEALFARPLLTPRLLEAILDRSDELIRREDEVWDFFVTKNAERLNMIIKFGINKLNSAQRSEILDVLVTHEAGLQARADIVEDDAQGHGLFGGERKLESERLFSSKRITEAAVAIREQIARACVEGMVWNAPIPAQLIWAWKRMDGGDAVSDWLEKIIANDELVVRLGSQLLGRSYQTGGQHGARVVWTFRRSDWKPLFDVDGLFRRLESLAPTNADAATVLVRLLEAEKATRQS